MPPDNDRNLDRGSPGASSRREYATRALSRERRVRWRHPRIGGLLLSLRDEPPHQRAWARRADGEESVARSLAKRVNAGAIVLNDRRIPGSRANIDHIAVTPAGVWVIDTKRYGGKVAVERPMHGEPRLTIGGRDKTTMVEGLASQVASVTAFVGKRSVGVPVYGVLCFVDADLPFLGTLRCGGYELLYPRALAKRLNGPGPMSDERLRMLAQQLSVHFPHA